MRILIAAAIFVARAMYAALGLLPRRHKVVMLSRQADLPSKDFTLLAEELRREDPSLEVVVRCRFIGSSIIARVAYAREVLVQMYHLATSRVCVLDGYSVPLSVLNHGSDLFVVQLWHALGAIKQFGYQSLDRPGGRSSAVARGMKMHRNYDVVVCGGPATIPLFAEAFRVDPRIVLPLGLPRVDYLRDGASAGPDDPVARELITRFPRLADTTRTRVLYAPTFRKNGARGFSAMAEAFGPERFTLVCKPHDLESVLLDRDNVVDAAGTDVLDLLRVCDAVVTDYSGVAFEACAAGLPVYFYLFDIEEYKARHGLNIDPREVLPAACFDDAALLAEAIADGAYDAAALALFGERYVTVPQGGCTAALARIVSPAPRVQAT